MYLTDFSRLYDLRYLFSPLPDLGDNPPDYDDLSDLDEPQVVGMQYTNWATCQNRPALMASLRRHKWCSLVDLCDFVEAHKMTGFHVHASRLVVIAAVTRLRSPAPFGQTQRFPEDEEMVDLDASSVRLYFDQLHQACDQNDRAQNVSNAQPNGSVSDAKRAFDVAFAKIRDFATASSYTDKDGVWTRETFEARYGLVWGNPAPANQA